MEKYPTNFILAIISDTDYLPFADCQKLTYSTYTESMLGLKDLEISGTWFSEPGSMRIILRITPCGFDNDRVQEVRLVMNREKFSDSVRKRFLDDGWKMSGDKSVSKGPYR
jgi:hypothetical protein